MRIRVTQREINDGVQGDCFHCPVALALKRAFNADSVWVGQIIIVIKAGRRQAFVTPPEAEEFLEAYDSAVVEFECPWAVDISSRLKSRAMIAV